MEILGTSELASERESNSGDTNNIIYFVSILLAVVLFGTLATIVSISAQELGVDTINQYNKSFIATNTSTETLIYSGDVIISYEVNANNDTWLDFSEDNNVATNLGGIESFSFWYKNITEGWQHIVNASGTTYINGSIGAPLIYPIYYNGATVFIGQFNSTDFFNGSIDDFRAYSTEISPAQVETLYEGGRQ